METRALKIGTIFGTGIVKWYYEDTGRIETGLIMKIINIGKDNATFQQIYALKENRNKRAQTKMFFVEGVQNIKDAISYNWEIEAFIYANNTNLSDWAKSILNKANFNHAQFDG